MSRTLFQTIIAIVILTLMAGCAATKKPVIAAYDSNVDYQLPEVTIFFDEPSATLKQKCLAFDNESSLSHCRFNIVETDLYRQKFSESKIFKQVTLADKNVEYSIAIATASMDNESAKELSQAAISGLSLMIIPLTQESDIHVEATIYWRNIAIKQYTYQLPHIASVSLFSDNDKADDDFSQSVASHIIADIQKDDVLTGTFLTSVLGASDYQKELTVPDQISSFSLVGQYIYNDPLLGSVSTYANSKFHNDKIDLYVYPIRRVNIDDDSELLARESTNIKQEFSQAAKQLKWENIAFADPQPITIKTNDLSINGVYFQGEYDQELGEKAFTSVYLFKLRDKFVKFRASFPENFITTHIKDAIAQIEVPNESPFMEKLRQQGRRQQ